MEGQAEEVAGLVAARYGPRLVLGPEATVLADGRRQVVKAVERSGAEAPSVDLAHRVVQSPDFVHEPVVGPAGG